MVRAPCCEKMGLKKGPWTSEEDQVLINYIKLYGHGNWRALPKQAGLLRCGKSCRLRWTNYLRPDIKRGNFSREEEDTIIELHEMLGNRWSAIAARLPGRTDNEIKNVWHTHLKKRLIKQNYTNLGNHNIINRLNYVDQNAYVGEEDEESFKFRTVFKPSSLSTSSPHCSSDTSSVITVDNNNNNNNNDGVQVNNNNSFSRNLPESDDNFWLEVLSNDQYNGSTACFSGFEGETQVDQFHLTMQQRPELHEMSSNMHETMDFWYHVFSRGGELPELKEII